MEEHSKIENEEKEFIVSWIVKTMHRAEKADDEGSYRGVKARAFLYFLSSQAMWRLLYCWVELAEHRCNYILLPDRNMNTARFNCLVNGKINRLYDEVPVMLYHLFDKEWFGSFFKQTDALSSDKNDFSSDVVKWIERECLVCGFEDGIMDKEHVIPLLENLPTGEAKWLTKEAEIRGALIYMIHFLETRQKDLEKN